MRAVTHRFFNHGVDLLALVVLVLGGLLLPIFLSRAPHQTTFSMDTPEVVLPRTGMNDLEKFTDQPGTFRWTNGDAQFSLPNPGAATRVSITMVKGPGNATPVRVQSGGVTFAFDVGAQQRAYTMLLPPSPRDRFNITIQSPTVRDRKRDIGVVVSRIGVSGAGTPAPQTLLVLAMTGVAVYLLLRQAGWRSVPGAGVVLIAQAAIALWVAAVGWRYALTSTFLIPIAAGSLIAVGVERWWPRYAAPPDKPTPIAWRREWLLVALLVVASLAFRMLFLAVTDPVGDMELSARRMWLMHEYGLAGAYRLEGDYMPIRLYVLRGLSELVPLLGGSYFTPLPAVTMILLKIPSLLADLATIVVIYVWSRRWLSAGHAAGLTALYTFAPPVWMNVAWWGQVDAWLMLPLLGVVALLDRAGGRWSWLCWAAALLVKAQAILLAPLIVISTLRLHGSRGLLQGGAIAAVVLTLAGLPFILVGQGEGMLQAYLGSTERFPHITIGAYNLWFLLFGDQTISDSILFMDVISYRRIGLLLLSIATLLICVALLRRSDRVARAESAAALALAFFTLPTQIHERYLFLPLAFLCLAAAADRRLLIIFVVLVVTATLNILGMLSGFWPAARVFISNSPLPMICAAVNLLMLCALLGHLLWSTRKVMHAPVSTFQSVSADERAVYR
jgi:Gpi18-like mannosyltransferase